MITPWLSILLPSINPSDREEFIRSLKQNVALDMRGIEILIDSEPGGVMPAFERLAKRAQANWVWLTNDNLMCETQNWDREFYRNILMFPDQIAMYYPNDCVFGHQFACFPLLPTRIFRRLFPVPYQKYKLDDEIMDIIPKDRQFYLNNVIMRHDVGNPTSGFKTELGKIYPVDEKVGRLDEMRFLQRVRYRKNIMEDLKSCLMKNQIAS